MARVAHISLLLMLCGLAIAGCGGSTSPRMMQTLTVSPASADAQNFPGGRVQFTTVGTFNMAPMMVTSPAVLWSIGNPFTPPTNMPAATIDQNGVAVCNGFVGTAIVEATAPAEPLIPLLSMNGSTQVVSASAQLVCP